MHNTFARHSPEQRYNHFFAKGRWWSRTNTVRQIVFGAQQRFHSPSPPQKRRRGPGRGGRFSVPLSPALSPLLPRGERGKTPSAFFMPNTAGRRPAVRVLPRTFWITPAQLADKAVRAPIISSAPWSAGNHPCGTATPAGLRG